MEVSSAISHRCHDGRSKGRTLASSNARTFRRHHCLFAVSSVHRRDWICWEVCRQDNYAAYNRALRWFSWADFVWTRGENGFDSLGNRCWVNIFLLLQVSMENFFQCLRTAVLLTLFSQIMVDVKVPIIAYRKSSGFEVAWFELFKLFPVLLSISIMWIVCLVLTLTDVFEQGNQARTDVRLNVMADAPWFRIPYPFQFGLPTFTVSAILGMLAGVLACTVESLSYYPTVAKMCGEFYLMSQSRPCFQWMCWNLFTFFLVDAAAPPAHVINRGVLIEGLGCIMAGIWVNKKTLRNAFEI